MKRSQSGFSVVEGLLIFTSLLLVSCVGFYIFSKHNSKNSSLKKGSSHRYIKDPGSTETWEEAKANKTVISPDEISPRGNSFTIDFSLCSVGTDEFGFGMGSTSFYFEGIKDSKCHFYMGTEVENPQWDGRLDVECFVPLDYNKTFTAGPSLGFEKDYCSGT